MRAMLPSGSKHVDIEKRMATTATIFHIERHALHDGPGIRTLVFFKGCPLRCHWCCNPEGQLSSPELIYDREKCTGCGSCVKVCPARAASSSGEKIVTERLVCTASLSMAGNKVSRVKPSKRIGVSKANDCNAECVKECPAGARKIVGHQMTVEEVLSIVVRDEVFYRHSQGGVTASGGEPLLHAQFLAALFGCCASRGINTAVETCGNVPWERFEQILRVTDLFLYDLKHMDLEKHRKYTGVPNTLILDNLRALGRSGKEIVVRVPFVPGFNDTLAEIAAIADFVSSLGGTREMHLLPFHRLGISKYRKLEREYPANGLLPPKISFVQELADKIQASSGVLVKMEV
jgi:pyruvate formate lyase activating enzyme